MGLAFVAGRVVDLAVAQVPLMDRGFLLGDGIFETLRTARGQVWCPEQHRARFVMGAKELGLEADVASLYDDAIEHLVAAGNEEFDDDLYLRINLTGGAMEDVPGGSGASITGICKRFQPYPMRHYSHGVRVVTSRLQHPGGSGAKSTSMHVHMAARREALNQTAHDAVLLSGENVVEATTSNVFALVGETVHAPGSESGAVSGVTRGVVLDVLADADFTISDRLTAGHMEHANEIWLTNSIGGVVPVTNMDGREIAKGDVATNLGHSYENLLRGR